MKNARAQKDSKEFEVMNGFQPLDGQKPAMGIPVLSEAMANLKNGSDGRLLSKNNSLSRLSSSVGAAQPKAGKKASNKDVNGESVS